MRALSSMSHARGTFIDRSILILISNVLILYLSQISARLNAVQDIYRTRGSIDPCYNAFSHGPKLKTRPYAKTSTNIFKAYEISNILSTLVAESNDKYIHSGKSIK